MNGKVRIITVTDGDNVAKRVIEHVASKLSLRCISSSAGNPTTLSGEEIVEQIKKVPKDPVLVMFDDKGEGGQGFGEKALGYVAQHPDIDIIGALAVASNTEGATRIKPNFSVTAEGKVIELGVDKKGNLQSCTDTECQKTINGDTAEVLGELHIPIVVGIGDIGKMEGKDALQIGAPITMKAVQLILDKQTK